MNIDTTFVTKSSSSSDTEALGEKLGARLSGGEVIELLGDVGCGKTVFVRGMVKGIGSAEIVQSPTFTVSRPYQGQKVRLTHYDFYRLPEPGMLATELAENLHNPGSAVVIEWSDRVEHVLPAERLRIAFVPHAEAERELTFVATGDHHVALCKDLA